MPIVIKYGGNAMTDPGVRLAVARAIGATAATPGREAVVVHGGGPFIEEELSREGIAARFVRGLRVTPPAAVAPVERALTLLGKRLAQEIGDAVSLTGRDAGLLLASRFDDELGRVGRMTRVNREVIERLLRARLTPVIACLALDEEGEPLNVNADEVAGAVAGALRCPLIFLTNVAGVLDDPLDAGTLLPRLDRKQARERIDDGRIAGGMIPKVEAALSALEQGATSASIADGRVPHGLLGALDGSGGTLVVP